MTKAVHESLEITTNASSRNCSFGGDHPDIYRLISEGDTHIVKGQPGQAKAKHVQIIKLTLDSDGLQVVFPLNLAAVYLKQGRPEAALICATCAMLLTTTAGGPPNEKAAFRAAKAAQAMGSPAAALWPLAEQFAKSRGHASAAMKQLATELEQATGMTMQQCFARKLLEKGSGSCKVGEWEFVQALIAAVGKPDATKDPAGSTGNLSSNADRQRLLMKEEGNKAFSRGDCERAVKMYRVAMQGYVYPHLALLKLSGDAEALKDDVQRALFASASLAYSTCQRASFDHVVAAAASLGLKAASKACKKAAEILRSDVNGKVALKWTLEMMEEIGSTPDQLPRSHPGKSFTAKEQAKLFQHGVRDRCTLCAEDVEFRDKALAILLRHPAQLKAIEADIGPMPPINIADLLVTKHGVPEGCDERTIKGFLAKGAHIQFESWFACTMHREGILEEVRTWKGDEWWKRHLPVPGGFSDGELLARLRLKSPEREDWFKKAPVGDVDMSARGTWLEESDAGEKLLSFANAPQKPLPIVRSGTHVSVGFTDLGELAETLASWHEAEGGAQGGSPGEPLRWVGVEASGYSCAKALVITQMVKDNAPADSVVQVWYSAGWTADALLHFHSAVTSILMQHRAKRLSFTPIVGDWMEAWSSKKSVPLEHARTAWLERQLEAAEEVFHVIGRQNLLDAAHFAVTGDVPTCPLEEWQPVTGSVVLFARPSSKYDQQVDENPLQNLPMKQFAKALQGARTVREAAVEVMRRRVDALSKALHDNEVTIEVLQAAVQLRGNEMQTVKYIASLHPTSMNWSNLCEYMPMKEFHSLALSTAAPGVPHFMHSMNWPLEVKGAFVMDYPDMPVKQQLAKIQEGVDQVRRSYGRLGVERHVRARLPGTSSEYADMPFKAKLLHSWLKAVSESIDIESIHVHHEVVHAPEFWNFYHNCQTVHFMLKYDHQINIVEQVLDESTAFGLR